MARVSPQWGPWQLEVALCGMHSKRRRRTTVKLVLTVFVITIIVGVAIKLRRVELGAGELRTQQEGVQEMDASRVEIDTSDGPLQLVDGSIIHPLVGGTKVQVLEVTAEGICVALVSGAARFDVSDQSSRPFLVVAGEVTAEVSGTVFSVAHRRSQVLVAVERGRVWVSWPGGQRALIEEEVGIFPPALGSGEARGKEKSVTMRFAASGTCEVEGGDGARISWRLSEW